MPAGVPTTRSPFRPRSIPPSMKEGAQARSGPRSVDGSVLSVLATKRQTENEATHGGWAARRPPNDRRQRTIRRSSDQRSRTDLASFAVISPRPRLAGALNR